MPPSLSSFFHLYTVWRATPTATATATATATSAQALPARSIRPALTRFFVGSLKPVLVMQNFFLRKFYFSAPRFVGGITQSIVVIIYGNINKTEYFHIDKLKYIVGRRPVAMTFTLRIAARFR